MISINLLPWRDKEKKIYERQFWALCSMTIILSILIGTIWKNSIQSQANLKNIENSQLKNEIAMLDDRLTAIASIKKENETLLSHIQMIQALHYNRSNTVDLMSDIATAVPPGLVLTSLVREADTIIIEGKAESNSQVAQFMRNIENVELLKIPILSVIQAEAENTSRIEFNLKASQTSKEEASENNV
jgi:type IV pilus assembly protein PilN